MRSGRRPDGAGRTDTREVVERLVGEAATGHVGGVEGSGRRTDHQVGFEVVVGERLEHADLDGAEAATPGEDERRAHQDEKRSGNCSTMPSARASAMSRMWGWIWS